MPAISTVSLFAPKQTIQQEVLPPKSPISEILYGKNAFYKKPDYVERTKQEFSQRKALPAAYVIQTEHKVMRIAKQILSAIIFPVGIYHLIHALAGKLALLPASTPALMGYPADYAYHCRSKIELAGEWKHKRITIEVDGYKIDAMIVGKASTFHNGRWVLASNGNGEFYEQKVLYKDDIKQILTAVKGNGIVFNYPGVGSSTGLPNRKAMEKAYRAMLRFMEDEKMGIGAKEIVGYGHSIGGGVQGDALKGYGFRKDVKYVFIKSRTFSDLSTTASLLTNRALGFAVKLLNWNMDCVQSSRSLPVPEIILQTAKVGDYAELTSSEKLRPTDGIIPREASLAKALLDDHSCPKHNKVFIGMPEWHNDGLDDPGFLAQKADQMLKACWA